MSPDQKPPTPPNLPSEPEKKTEPPPESRAGLVSNTLTIVALVLIAIVVLWGLIHFLTLSGSWFSSLIPRSTPSVQITAPKESPTNQPLPISWTYQATNAGNFALVYQCDSDVRLALLGSDNIVEPFACGVSFPVGSSTAATLIPQLTSTSSANMLLSVVFSAQGGVPIEGTATITITPETTQPNPASVAPTSNSAPPRQPSNHIPVKPVPSVAVGSADLSVSILASGYIDPSSGALLMNRAPTPGDVVGVEFDIRNNGPRATGSWYFEAHLPTSSEYTYTSPEQKSLQPGDHVVNTLRFTDLAAGGGIFTVIADPSQQVNDPNRENNEASVTVY